MTTLDRFMKSCAAEITRRSRLDGPMQKVLREGADAFEAALDSAGMIEHERSSVAVTASLTDAPSTPLVDLVRAAEADIPWIPSHRLTDGGTEAALASLHEVRDLGDVICGLLLMAPGCTYPEHSHPPQEIYLPLTGGGRWRYGGNPAYRTVGPEDLIYNHPHDVHGIVADDGPLLAMYVLWPGEATL